MVKHLFANKAQFDLQKRRIFADKMVFTIDPDTAKDFDDSCSVELVMPDSTLMTFKQLADMGDTQR